MNNVFLEEYSRGEDSQYALCVAAWRRGRVYGGNASCGRRSGRRLDAADPAWL